MEIPPYRLLVIDTSSHALLMVDGPSGYIENELYYPDNVSPTGLFVTCDQSRAYMPAADAGGKGALFAVNIEASSLYRLPIDVPHLTQFALAANQVVAYASDPGGTLYILDLVTLTVSPCGQSATSSVCNGLTVSGGRLYSVWEKENTGILATFDDQANLLSEQSLPGIPSGITSNSGLILTTFTNGPDDLEGVALFRPSTEGDPELITLSTTTISGKRLYPCSPLVTTDGQTAYIVNEDGQSISILELGNSTVSGLIQADRPLSSLALIHEGPLAIASAENALMLIDMVTKRPLAITDTPRRLAQHFAIIKSVPAS